MDKEILEGLLIDYIDGKLSDSERLKVETELSENEQSYQMYVQLKEVMSAMNKVTGLEPAPSLRKNFQQMLQSEMATVKPQGRTLIFHPAVWRIAAGVVLVMAGIGIGYWINKNQQQTQELARLREEMQTTKQMMMTMLENQQSASQRILGVNVAMKISAADDEVVQALSRTMNEDVNTNVRLAALDALSKFESDPAVRKILIQSLALQKDPIVQIALIQLMVRWKEKSVVNELQKIVDDTDIMKAVKDEAYTGLLKLS